MQALRREGRRSLWSRRAESSRSSRPAHVTGQRVRGNLAANLGGTTEHASSYTDGVLFLLPVFCGLREMCGCAPRAHKRGKPRFSPSCESPPPEEGRGCPRPQTNFIHILWKNLICDNVAAVWLCAGPGRRGCCRCKVCACRLREGDAPAGCRCAGARCAPPGDTPVSGQKSTPPGIRAALVFTALRGNTPNQGWQAAACRGCCAGR